MTGAQARVSAQRMDMVYETVQDEVSEVTEGATGG